MGDDVYDDAPPWEETWLPLKAATWCLTLVKYVRRLIYEVDHVQCFSPMSDTPPEVPDPPDLEGRLHRVRPGDWFDHLERRRFEARLVDVDWLNRRLPDLLECLELPREWFQVPEIDHAGYVPDVDGWSPIEWTAVQILLRELRNLEEHLAATACAKELPTGWELHRENEFPVWPVRNVAELHAHLEDWLNRLMHSDRNWMLDDIRRELRNARRSLRLWSKDEAKRPKFDDNPPDINQAERELESLVGELANIVDKQRRAAKCEETAKELWKDLDPEVTLRALDTNIEDACELIRQLNKLAEPISKGLAKRCHYALNRPTYFPTDVPEPLWPVSAKYIQKREQLCHYANQIVGWLASRMGLDADKLQSNDVGEWQKALIGEPGSEFATLTLNAAAFAALNKMPSAPAAPLVQQPDSESSGVPTVITVSHATEIQKMPSKPRGRPRRDDPDEERILAAWDTGHHKSYQDCADVLGLVKWKNLVAWRRVERCVDARRKRVERKTKSKTKRRTK